MKTITSLELEIMKIRLVTSSMFYRIVVFF